jgi:hypothetical protein
MAQCFQDARHPDLVGGFQDLGEVVAGGAPMRLDQSVGENPGDLSQAQELLLEHVRAGAVLAELALVFGMVIPTRCRQTSSTASCGMR